VVGINPNKVYQYLAAGIPAVTTPLLDLAPRPPHLQYAATAEEMVAAVRTALAAPPDRAARRAIAREHDWDAIAARMVEIMQSRLAAVSSPSPD
jgi:glycosyltransferase involved in cell wall biosynthesis